MRQLTKYAVFMSAREPVHLYGVLALGDPFAKVLHEFSLPALVKTTLMPFKGQVIYDGIVNSYGIHIGPNIRANLNATYQKLKPQEGIVEQVVSPEGEPGLHFSAKPYHKLAPDWQPAIAEMAAQVEKMKSVESPIQAAALGLLRAAIHVTQTAFEQLVITLKDLRPVRRELKRLESLLYGKGLW